MSDHLLPVVLPLLLGVGSLGEGPQDELIVKPLALMLIQFFERTGDNLAAHSQTETGDNSIVVSDERLTEAANKCLRLRLRPCAVFMRAARDKNGLSLVAVLDLFEKSGNVPEIIHQQGLHAEALQVIYGKLLFY